MTTIKLASCTVLSLVMTANACFSLQLQKDFPENFSIKVTNPLMEGRENVLVVVPAEQIDRSFPRFNAKAFVVLDNNKEIPSQYNSTDPERKGVVFVLDKMNPSEQRTIVIRFNKKGEAATNYTKRTQAELSPKTGGSWVERKYVGGNFSSVKYLRVPKEHKDHSYYIRYEGPGWESDKVGYRLYLDQRNAIDVFGKLNSQMVLHQVGLDGFESYHHMQPWGMDIMKVNKSLGLGSVGMFFNGAAERVEKTDSVTCQVTENGSVYSSLLSNYYGWSVGDKKYDVQSAISIHAGTRVSQQRLIAKGNPENICTGIIKDNAALLITTNGDDKHFGYLATYGKQSLNNDELGLAVLFNPKDFIEFTKDENSHIVKLKPNNGKLNYYFVAAWVKEPEGIQHEGEFIKYLYHVAEELANPVKVEIVK